MAKKVKPAKKLEKKAAPKKAAPAKKVAKAPMPKKAAKPAPKKAVVKPAVKKVAKAPVIKKVAAKSTAMKMVKSIGKLLKGKKEVAPAKPKINKAAEMKAKKDALKANKEKEKEAKKAAKEQDVLDKKQAKIDEKANKKSAKEVEKTKGKAAPIEAEKPRRGRGEEDDLFSDDDFTDGEEIEDLGEFDFEEEEVAAKPKRGSLSELDSLETRISDEITNLAEHFDWNEIHEAVCTLDFFVDNKSDECMEKGCDNLRTTQGYCRLHYIKNSKTIKRKKEILREGKLQDYITELITKYPPKFIEQMLADLTDDREFYKVLNDLGITTNYNYEEVEDAVVPEEDDDDVMLETRTIVTARLGYDDEEM
ncbi:MAG: hypothetical protein ACOYL6_01330 [Bacteriovoracaceae bacterium]